MKKSLRMLTVLSIAASSVLFATPSQAVVVGGVTVTVSGNALITSSSANKLILGGSSSSASDSVNFDFGGSAFSVSNINELTYSSFGGNVLGIPSTPEVGYNKTINMLAGYGYMGTFDVYSGGSIILQGVCPSGTAVGNCYSQKANRAFEPFIQLNYTASSGVLSVRVPVTSGTGSNITINTDGTFSLSSGTVTSWVQLTNFVVGAGAITAPGAPTSVVATATGKRSATVSFAAPASNGGSAVISYTATSTPGGLTQTLTQATGGTFNFDGLQPGTAYTFAVTATNAIGMSAAATSNSVTTTPLVVASLSSLSFTDDGTGTGGKIVWSGKNIDAVLYTGSAAFYPGPYNYGAFTSGWNGRIRNLTPGTEYTVSLYAISADGVGESKSLTFKTSVTLPALAGAKSSTTSQADQMAAQLPKLFAWINENVFVDGEGDRMKMILNKFDATKAPKSSAYLKLPNSSVVSVSAISSTPAVCTVEGQLTVRSITAGTCTISYLVTGGSKAPATMVKNFVFNKFAK